MPSAAVTAGETGVLRIEAGGCGAVRQASATVVDDGGRVVVLTNAHVVRGSGTALVRSPSGAVVSAQVTGSVQGRDAAVLELDEGDTREVEALEIGPPPQVGHELVVVGHPEGHTDAAAERSRQKAVLGRLGSPDDAAGALRYLLEADYVTGHTLVVDGGRLLCVEEHSAGRVVLNVHHPSDVVAGWARGYAYFVGCLLLVERVSAAAGTPAEPDTVR